MVINEDTDLYSIAVPDPEHTLGGLKEDIEPEHPSVIGHIGTILLTCCPFLMLFLIVFHIEHTLMSYRFKEYIHRTIIRTHASRIVSLGIDYFHTIGFLIPQNFSFLFFWTDSFVFFSNCLLILYLLLSFVLFIFLLDNCYPSFLDLLCSVSLTILLSHAVKSLMPGQDLTRVTIPAFFLEPRSLLERMADTMMHPDLMLNVSDMEDPLERFKSVVRWYLSGWHYKTVCRGFVSVASELFLCLRTFNYPCHISLFLQVGVKKPYNPIIGETFACFWDHEDGSRSQYFAEQVLHRPPISAIYFENRQHNMSASAHIWTKSQFSAPQTTKSILDGACSKYRQDN